MDYEKKYNEAIERAKQFMSEHPTRAEADLMVALFPELRESEDERIRKSIIHILQVGGYMSSEEKDKAFAYLEKQKDINCLACDEHLKGYLAGRKVTEEKQKELPFVKDVMLGYPGLYFYDGERMHFQGNPAMEEKQKEQKPVEPSDEELERHQDELYNFKVFATKQAKEHHISFVHDFEWNNFCSELLSYFNEKQKPVEIHIDNPNIEKFDPDVKIITSDSSADSVKSIEWSEEDEKTINDACCWIAEYAGYLMDKNYSKASMLMSLTDKLKSLRPQPHTVSIKDATKFGNLEYERGVKDGIQHSENHRWKPSEEQMEALNYAIAEWDGGKKLEGLYALRNDLKKLM